MVARTNPNIRFGRYFAPNGLAWKPGKNFISWNVLMRCLLDGHLIFRDTLF
jgi:hypothetical protein